MTGDMTFENPPPSKARSAKRVVDELAPLRERPGEWARVRGPLPTANAANFASSVRHGYATGITAGDYEATVRTLEDGCYVWVRYVGNGAS